MSEVTGILAVLRRGPAVIAQHLGLIKRLWLAVVLAVLGWYLVVHWREIVVEPLNWPAMAAAFGLTLAGKIFSALQVRISLAQSGAHIGLASSFYAYSLADLGKYIPGGFWGFVSRIALYRLIGLGATVAMRALLIEQAWLVGASLATGALLYGLAWSDSLLSWSALASLSAAPLWASALYGMRALVTTRDGAPPSALALFMIHAALWAFLGAGFAALVPTAPATLAAGSFCIAFAAGLLVPFAPGGLGVREATVIALMLPALPMADLVRILLLSRVVWIAADLTFAAATLLTAGRAWRMATTQQAG